MESIGRCKDKFGRDIFVRDFILYPTYAGSVTNFRIGKVLKMFSNGEEYRIIVMPLIEEYGKYTLGKKIGVLLFPDKLLRYYDIPRECTKLLDGITYENARRNRRGKNKC